MMDVEPKQHLQKPSNQEPNMSVRVQLVQGCSLWTQ